MRGRLRGTGWSPEEPMPRPQDMRPGATFRHDGATLKIESGKHGNGDLRVVLNGSPVSYRIVSLLVMALYVSEERYLSAGKRGGEYFVSTLAAWIHWTRSQLDKPARLPSAQHPLGEPEP